MNQRFPLVVVGAGPAGLSAAARARAAGLECVLLERAEHLADTVHCYQRGKPVMAEPSGVPLRSDVPFAAARREEVLGAWEQAAAGQGLPLRLGEEVRAVERLPGAGGGARLRVRTSRGAYDADHVVLALGTQGNRRGLGVPGEELPHVSHRLVDPAEHRDEEIVVIGAGDSALEVALALAEANRVHLVVRRPEIVRGKESLEREVRQLAARGQLTIHFSTVVARIEPAEIVLTGPEGELRVAARRVFLMLGAEPPRRFLEKLGVRFSGTGRDARPVLDGAHGCPEVPGLHLIGAVSGRGDLIKLGMNQGWEVVEAILGHSVEPADEPVLAARLPAGEGTVRERLARLRQAVPLFAAAEEADLRETFLSAETREVAAGEVVMRQNDYTNSVLVVLEGRVEVAVAPEGQADGERLVATLGPGRFCGEMGLISGQRRNATVRAVGPVQLVEISRRAMLKLMAVAPAVKRLIDETFLVRAFQTYLFPDLPRDSLERLVGEATVEERGRGEVVFEEGAEGDAFFVVRSGMVKVSQGRGERQRVLSYLPAGNFFGEAALLPGSRRGATVSTIFPTELIRLGSDRFQAFVERNPELGPRLLAELEERQVASMAAAATPGFAEIQSRLIDEEIVMGTDVLLIDDHKCIRCGNCIAACEAVHDDGQARLTLTGIHFYNLLFPSSCWQCEDPLCMLDCPPDALVRDASGEIHVKSTCIGCGNCEANCPYGNIFLVHPREDQPFGFLRRLLGLEAREAEREVAVKCDMTGRPGGPACVLACPTGAAMRLSRAECEETLAEILVQRGDG